MEDRITSRTWLLGILVLFVMLTVPTVSAYDHDQTYDANATYFVLEDIRVSQYGESQTVAVWANMSVPIASGRLVLNYTCDCANITGISVDTTNFPQSGDPNYACGWANIPFLSSVGRGPGEVHICDITIECCNVNIPPDCCGTDLTFDNSGTGPAGAFVCELVDTNFDAVANVNWASGTFLCGDAIEVTKTIWDGSNWVDAIGPLGSEWLGQDVRFNITVTSGCLDLSDLVVEDIMDSSLLYNNNANPPETSSTTHTVTWNIGSLSASTSTSIEFNATIDGYGTSVNDATVTAGVTDLGGVEVSATDQASVTTMPPAGIDVTKTIWDSTAWVEEITDATIGDTYRFRCEMENSGSTGMDLVNIEVWDLISPGLEYANSAMIMTPNGVWRSIEPPTSITYPVEGTNVSWTIDNFLQDPLILQPSQAFVVEYNVTVVDYGYNCNDIHASGYCEAALSDVEGNDTACINTPMPDMTVTDITVNYDLCSYAVDKAFGPTNHPGNLTQENKISADITELNGIDVIIPFDVTFEIDGTPVCTVQLPGIAAGATETVYCDDQFRPMADVTYTITITADSLTPSGEVAETNETNNVMAKDITAMTLGYKGNHYQDGRSLTTVDSLEGTINLVYSVGDSYYLSSYYNPDWTTYQANWTTIDLPMPATDTCIKKAILYVYYNWDKTPGRNVTDYFSLDFNGYTIPVNNHYSDIKWEGHYPYGMLAYDVANVFSVTDDNTATLTDSYPGGDKVSMDGMLLVVVYNHSSEADRIILINEGYDMLGASTTGASYNYGVSSEEAIAYADFTGSIPIETVIDANLITVAPGASDGGDMNRLYFNGGMWNGIWNSYSGATQLGMNETDVRTYLDATDNNAGFQSYIPDGGTSGDGFRAANAFLVVEKGRTIIEVEAPLECIGVGQQFDVPINITPMGASVYGVEYELSFDPDVIHAEWQNEGNFLNQGGASTNVYVNNIDNSAGTVSFAVTRTNTNDGATEPGTLATIHFTAEQIGTNSTLTLTSVKVSDPQAQSLSMESIDSTVYVCDNVPPVAVASCLFKYNNVGTKYMSKTYFDGSESSDDPEGSITNYRWYFGDGNYGAGESYDHIYGSWSWNGASYDPFEVILTVEDDGIPMMDNSTTILVNVYIAGDCNGDGEVDIFDATIVGLEWDKECTSGIWDTDRKDQADLNNDCIVDIFDAVIIGANWDHIAW